jgi:hypothetical protein
VSCIRKGLFFTLALGGLLALALCTVGGCAHTNDFKNESALNVYYARLADYKRICQGPKPAPEPACKSFQAALIAVLDADRELSLAELRGGAADMQAAALKAKLDTLNLAAIAAGAQP